MNTIFAQMIEDCCYILAILIEKVKLCDDLTFNYYGTCTMNCGIKEKEREYRGRLVLLFVWEVSSKNFD